MKIVFCSSEVTPTMVEFCSELNKICNATFLFYSPLTSRPGFWNQSKSSKHCYVAERSYAFYPGVYYSREIERRCKDAEPDVVILGGILIPSNMNIYRWCLRKNIPVFIFSEPFGFSESVFAKFQYFKSNIFKKLVSQMYGRVSGIFAIGEAGAQDFSKIFARTKIPIIKTQYPVLISDHLQHMPRQATKTPKLLFPHRLVDLYNPTLAIYWFREILNVIPGATLGLNAFGNMRHEIENLISSLEMDDSVYFVDNVLSWNDLHKVYRDHDIILSTKTGRFKSDSCPWGTSDWGMTEMEACASAMGMVVSDCSAGLVGAMRKSRAGYIISRPDDIAAVVAAVCAYVEDPVPLEKDGCLLREEVRKYEVAAYASNFVSIIRGVLVGGT